MPVMGRSRCSVAMRLTHLAREGGRVNAAVHLELEEQAVAPLRGVLDGEPDVTALARLGLGVDVQEGQIAFAQGDEVAASAEIGLDVRYPPAVVEDREADLATGLFEADLETRVGPDCLRGVRELTGYEPAFPLQVGAERVGLAAAAEVGEDAMGAGAGEPERDGPAAVLRLLRVEVLEAAEVATHHDEMHAPGVFDVEVLHGGAPLVDDAEGELSLRGDRVGIVDHEAEAAVGLGEALGGASLRCRVRVFAVAARMLALGAVGLH